MSENNNIKISCRDEGIYHFCSPFDENSCKEFISWLLDLNLNKPKLKEITVIITSYGGSTDYCFAIIDALKGSRFKVNTVGLGVIASSGFMLFIAGDHRILTPNTMILSHQFSAGMYGKEHELIANQKRMGMETERMVNHYKKYIKKLSERKIREILLPSQDVWLTAEDAKRYGICDEIKYI